MTVVTEDGSTPRGPDRRKSPTPAFSKYWLRGRRRGGRRSGEIEDIYVHRPSRREWLLFLAIFGLATLAANAGERTRLGAAARQRVLDHFTWNRLGSRYHELFASLVGSHAGR